MYIMQIRNYLQKLMKVRAWLGKGVEKDKLKLIKSINVLRHFVGMCDTNISSRYTKVLWL